PTLCFVSVVTGVQPDLPSFPTRRSSDLDRHLLAAHVGQLLPAAVGAEEVHVRAERARRALVLAARETDEATHRHHRPRPGDRVEDRKSTRLNSSHVKISYAVFCLKKKKT